ncbi:hypothetical protein [Marinisporobacter balticus]|uniref:Uncharacterized protein n=1 Tax=Marinisporobacter balticus TaxID=2018667 RepID=A0A4R2KBT6_9FIRM|nr:hypothetical protein [Marinisporobacter balticus]TCO69527.1 hypothetical protein EV214_13151 [Marinisporobacter balticus]
MEILTRAEIDQLKKEDLTWVTGYLKEKTVFDADAIQKKWERMILTCDELETENEWLKKTNKAVDDMYQKQHALNRELMQILRRVLDTKDNITYEEIMMFLDKAEKAKKVMK